MNKLSTLLVLLLGVLLAACTARPAPLAPASPEEAGLVWRECAASALEAAPAEACFGPRPAFSDVDKARWATRTASGLRLAIAADTYETRHLGLGVIPAWPWDPYVLLKNGRPLQLLLGEFQTYDPDVSLQVIAGKAAWEFADPHQATVIYDGRDLRAVYGLQAAYAPYELGGKLAFVGKKSGRYFLVYDGRQVGPAFDRMPIAYCCEAMLYSPRGVEGRYHFWGWRGDTLYTVEVVPAPLPQGFKGWELYSWPVGADWRFTLIAGTNRNKTCEEVTTGGDVQSGAGLIKITVTGVEAIEGVLARLPQGEHVFWLGEARGEPVERCGSALALPDGAVVDDLKAHCRALGVELQAP